MGFMSKKQQAPTPRRRRNNDAAEPARATAEDLAARYTFRRNRTLTGSLSSRVSSVIEHTAELKSGRVHAHHLRRHRRHAFLGLLGSLAVVLGLLYLITQSIVTVTATTNAPQAVPMASYQQKIYEYLQKHPLERFRFSLNTGALTTYLQTHDMPEVSSVQLDGTATGSLGTAQLAMAFRQPVVVWQAGNTRTYVDAHGNSFTHNYYPEPTVQVVDQTGIQTQDNRVLASQHFLGFIGQVIGQMTASGYAVSQVILPANTTRQVQLRLDGVSYPIKVSIDRPVGEQVEDATRAIRYLAAKGIQPQYIDVRVSGKAYYQ